MFTLIIKNSQCSEYILLASILIKQYLHISIFPVDRNVRNPCLKPRAMTGKREHVLWYGTLFWGKRDAINTLRPGQDSRQFPDDIFKSFFLIKIH